MNWTAKVCGGMFEHIEMPVVGRHLPFAEMCEQIGQCAIVECGDALATGIEDFLRRPILEITGLTCGGEVEFRETYLVGESCFDFPIPRAVFAEWEGRDGTKQTFYFEPNRFTHKFDPRTVKDSWGRFFWQPDFSGRNTHCGSLCFGHCKTAKQRP